VAEKVVLGQISSEYFWFPYQFSLHKMLQTHLSPRAGTTGELVADVLSGLSLTQTQEIKNNLSATLTNRQATSRHILYIVRWKISKSDVNND
jgi:hypothetical protein